MNPCNVEHLKNIKRIGKPTEVRRSERIEGSETALVVAYASYIYNQWLNLTSGLIY